MESVRLYPVFPLMGRVALCDTTLPVGGGPDQDAPFFVPKGTLVHSNYFALHRDPNLLGDDVEAFKPERWDNIDPGQWGFMGFGGGSRACLGRQKSLIEAAFAAASEIAVALTTVFYCLLTNPHPYKRLVRELRGEYNSVLLDDSQQIENTLLMAVIKESLRLYPTNPNPMERVVPSGGLMSNGYHIRSGTIVSVPHYSTHRDPRIYGSDAERFNPDRWLNKNMSTKERMDRCFLTFGKGARACPGRGMAMLELRIFLTTVLRNFDVELATPESLPKVTMYWMLDHFGFNVKFRKARS
ncbi:hypothetical protein Daesc_009105 [Daldinia eschscholtzii]|uniref:Cytochrome P450 n=1 Tax=Daldinia eschscholtzii TaxID=292717 RepID=A0AAX6M977_9PEZI